MCEEVVGKTLPQTCQVTARLEKIKTISTSFRTSFLSSLFLSLPSQAPHNALFIFVILSFFANVFFFNTEVRKKLSTRNRKPRETEREEERRETRKKEPSRSVESFTNKEDTKAMGH